MTFSYIISMYKQFLKTECHCEDMSFIIYLTFLIFHQEHNCSQKCVASIKLSNRGEIMILSDDHWLEGVFLSYWLLWVSLFNPCATQRSICAYVIYLYLTFPRVNGNFVESCFLRVCWLLWTGCKQLACHNNVLWLVSNARILTRQR